MEVGSSIAGLDLLTTGLILDMWTEKANNTAYAENPVTLATREDFDRF